MSVWSGMIETRLLSGILATAWDEREAAFWACADGGRYPGCGVEACAIFAIGISSWTWPWALGVLGEFVSLVFVSTGRREAGKLL